MLFAELAPMPSPSPVVPVYDLEESLSILTDSTGMSVPYILHGPAESTTATVTLVRAESSDSDHADIVLGTVTATKVRSESSDDDSPPNTLRTTTVTRIKNESSDEDVNQFVLSGTQTITEVKTESTDED